MNKSIVYKSKWMLAALVGLSATAAGIPSPTLAAGPQQQQQDGSPVVSPMIEVSAGLERQGVDVSTPCTTACQPSGHGTDNSRGSPLLRFAFRGVNASELLEKNIGAHHLSFIPISVTLDSNAAGDSFGRVGAHEGTQTHIRQMIGALVEGNYNPSAGIISLRGKLARVEYNRDKGIWDWRALDASVGVQSAVKISGRTTLNLEVDVGGGIGGVHLNGMQDLSRALDIAPTMTGAYTLNPYVALRTGLYSPSIKVELIASAEQRFDLTPPGSRPIFHARELGVNSTHMMGAAEIEYTFGGKGLQQMGNRFSLFANAGYDFDTLTLSNVLFGSNDSFRSFIAMAGVRLQF